MYYVYRFLNKENTTIYVGRTGDIKKRIQQHFSNGHLEKEVYKQTKKILFLEFGSITEMKIKELYYISKYNPKYNTRDKDGYFFNEQYEKFDDWKLFKKEKNYLYEVKHLERITIEENFNFEFDNNNEIIDYLGEMLKNSYEENNALKTENKYLRIENEKFKYIENKIKNNSFLNFHTEFPKIPTFNEILNGVLT